MGRWRAWSQLKQLTAALRSPLPSLHRSLPTYFKPYPGDQGTGFCSPLFRFWSTIPAVSDSYDGEFVVGHNEHIQRSEWESREEEGTFRYIPVKAYFLSTSIDLKSMQNENSCYVIPPSSRSSNYIALRYSDYPLGIGVDENGDNCRYVVVFQYGSAVLFNIADHEAEQFLDMVRKHASGLLPEMRKDDTRNSCYVNPISPNIRGCETQLMLNKSQVSIEAFHHRSKALFFSYKMPYWSQYLWK